MEWMTTATTAAMGVLNTVIDTITGNTILALCFVMAVVIPSGIRLFKGFRH